MGPPAVLGMCLRATAVGIFSFGARKSNMLNYFFFLRHPIELPSRKIAVKLLLLLISGVADVRLAAATLNTDCLEDSLGWEEWRGVERFLNRRPQGAPGHLTGGLATVVLIPLSRASSQLRSSFYLPLHDLPRACPLAFSDPLFAMAPRTLQG